MYVLYFMLWMILFGSLTLESVCFGLVVAAAVLAFSCAFLDYSIKTEIGIYRKIPAFLHFLYLLVVDIIKSNFKVIQMIFAADKELEPVLVHFHTDLKTPVAKALQADSITLTPGTITVTLEDSDLVVHCLDESLAEGIDKTECAEELAKLEDEQN